LQPREPERLPYELDNLLFYEKLGYAITIKRVFKFEKEYIFKDYIDLNSALRKLAGGDEFSKALYKLLNNIIYGKASSETISAQKLKF
jgi:hypothetical protein